MAPRVAINGFGRIGEMFFRAACRSWPDVEVVAINDVISLDQIDYLLRYDSVHPPPAGAIEAHDDGVVVDGRLVRVFREREPEKLPWADLGVDIAVECTGVFRDRAGLERHRAAGAERVVLSAPAKGDGADVTVCVGVNHDDYDPARHRLVSNASCTTNCLAPVVRVIDEALGFSWGLMSTLHAYTGSQALVDTAQRSMRRGRAAAVNIVPTTTGAAGAIGLVLPHLAGRIDGMAFRVPVPDGSVVDLVFGTDRPFEREELHEAFRRAAEDPSYRGVIGITEEELVSRDIVGLSRSALVDATSTLLLGDRRAKVVAWYDNEWGYATRLLDLVRHMGAA